MRTSWMIRCFSAPVRTGGNDRESVVVLHRGTDRHDEGRSRSRSSSDYHSERNSVGPGQGQTHVTLSRRTSRQTSVTLVCLLALLTFGACQGDTDPGSSKARSEQASSILPVADFPTLRNERDQPLHLGSLRPVDVARSGWEASTLLWNGRRRDVAFGVEVCLDGARRVTLTKVSPVESTGTGYRATGSWVYSPARDESLAISIDGYAPAVRRGSVEAAAGHVFTFQCGQNTQPQQLLVGLRGTGPDGGGWTGVRVTYRTQDGTRHVLSTPVAGLLCGKSTDPC